MSGYTLFASRYSKTAAYRAGGTTLADRRAALVAAWHGLPSPTKRAYVLHAADARARSAAERAAGGAAAGAAAGGAPARPPLPPLPVLGATPVASTPRRTRDDEPAALLLDLVRGVGTAAKHR
jgi:hypothetical protein